MATKKIRYYRPEVHEGECWMLHDEVYNKEAQIKPDKKVRVIKYDRPCVVLSVYNGIATIIPFTSKYTNMHITYPLQIEEDKLSHAILSQVMTVELSRLNHYIGKIHHMTFNELKVSFYKTIEAKDKAQINHTNYDRYNHLAITRFYPFHVYKHPKKNVMFMALRCMDGSFIKLPVMAPSSASIDRETRSNSIAVFCGRMQLEYCDNVVEDDYKHEYIDLGFEYRPNVRKMIIKNITNVYGFALADVHYKDNREDITRALSYFYSNGAYNIGFQKLQRICSDSDLQTILYSAPNELFFKDRVIKKEFKANIEIIKDYVLSHLDPLKCNTICLEKLRGTNLLRDMICLYSNELYREDIEDSNRNWIAEYTGGLS